MNKWLKGDWPLTLIAFFVTVTHTFMCALAQAQGTNIQSASTNIKAVASCHSINLVNQAGSDTIIKYVSQKDLSYWQHMTANLNQFASLNTSSNPDFNRYKLQAYDFPSVSKKNENQKFDESFCYNQQITLVKKLIHNKHQHVNGIEVDLSNHKLTFGRLSSLTMRFQLNQSKNVMPEQSQLEHLLSNVINKSELKNELISKLISANLHLKLMFYGEHHSDHKTPTIYGEANIVLVPSLSSPESNLPKTELLKNKSLTQQHTWLELVIKSKELNTYWQQNWQETKVELKDITEQSIKGFILVAETPSGKTLESLLNDLPDGYLSTKYLSQQHSTKHSLSKRGSLDAEELFVQNYIRLGLFTIIHKNINE